jgi:hypothetical protein
MALQQRYGLHNRFSSPSSAPRTNLVSEVNSFRNLKGRSSPSLLTPRRRLLVAPLAAKPDEDVSRIDESYAESLLSLLIGASLTIALFLFGYITYYLVSVSLLVFSLFKKF